MLVKEGDIIKKLKLLLYSSRILIIVAIIMLFILKFYFKSMILFYGMVACATSGAFLFVICLVLYLRIMDNGAILNKSSKIVIETNVEEALKNGLVTEEQAQEVPETIVIESKFLFLNLVFNIAIRYHFDSLPVEVLYDELPNIPKVYLSTLYSKSQEVNDELNDYFRSQGYNNKADVISKSVEIKQYLIEKYPWMMADTIQNTYEYFFLGINNG